MEKKSCRNGREKRAKESSPFCWRRREGGWPYTIPPVPACSSQGRSRLFTALSRTRETVCHPDSGHLSPHQNSSGDGPKLLLICAVQPDWVHFQPLLCPYTVCVCHSRPPSLPQTCPSHSWHHGFASHFLCLLSLCSMALCVVIIHH